MLTEPSPLSLTLDMRLTSGSVVPDCDGTCFVLLVVAPFTSLTLMRLSLETDLDCAGAPVLDVAALVF